MIHMISDCVLDSRHTTFHNDGTEYSQNSSVDCAICYIVPKLGEPIIKVRCNCRLALMCIKCLFENIMCIGRCPFCRYQWNGLE